MLDIFLRAADSHGELFERAAARLLEHARVVAARLLCLALGKPDAVMHRLRHAHRLGRSFFEELFEMGFFKRAVALGKGVAFEVAVMLDEVFGLLDRKSVV